jgi:hypothetical protein
MARERKPIPKNQSQITQEALPPAYLQSQGKPINDTIFTKNRALQNSRKTDDVKDVTIGLEDIDYALKYYFENIIKPTVVLDGNRMDVPVFFGSPERWQSIQADGYYRDTNGRAVVPLIMFKRTNIEKNRTLGNKIDGNNVSLFQVFETRYNQRNQYDKFSILTNRTPSKQYYMSVVPDYVNITYDVSILTNYVTENNKIIEAIQFASDSYWGDKNRWQFRTYLDNLATTTTVSTGEDRFALTTVSLKVYGYLIPDSINKKLANSSVAYSTSQIIFGLETTTDLNTISPTTQIADSNTIGSTSFIGDGVSITNIDMSLAIGDLTYLNTNKVLKADIITTPNTAIFTGAAILQPDAGSSLPPTTINNFVVYVNGQYVPSNVVSFVPYVGGVSIQFNTALLAYDLETDDEVIAIGKFQ